MKPADMSPIPGKYSTHQKADLCILVILAGLIAAYLFHVLSVSTHLLNIILVLPASALALVLCGFELFCQSKAPGEEERPQESVRSVLPVIALFSAYVFTLPWLGFDVGTAVFVAAFLLVHGEKRWHWAIAYGVVFGSTVALAFSTLLPYPMPMLLMASEY